MIIVEKRVSIKKVAFYLSLFFLGLLLGALFGMGFGFQVGIEYALGG